MRLIVISNSKTSTQEIQTVVKLFQEGLELFHLRKPKASRKDVEEYIRQIPPEFYNRIVLHSHHALAGKYKLGGIHLGRRHRKRKFRNWLRLRSLKMKVPNLIICRTYRSLSRLIDNEKHFSYVMLSPIFDSIGNSGHSAGYSTRKLQKILPSVDVDVVALGGIDHTTIAETVQMGFKGAAIWGSLWEPEVDAVQRFREIKEIADTTPIPVPPKQKHFRSK